MRKFFDYFRKHPEPEEPEEPEEQRDLGRERTFGDGATQRERLIRLQRKAHHKHMRRQRRR